MSLKGIGAKRTEQFHKLGINTVGALIRFFPRDYYDFSKFYKICQCSLITDSCIKVSFISDFKLVHKKGNVSMYKAIASDGCDSIDVILFYDPYWIHSHDSKNEYLLLGKVVYKNSSYQIFSPLIEPYRNSSFLKPIYRQTSGLNSNTIAKYVKQALSMLPEPLEDTLPQSIKDQFSLCDLRFALHNVHFPSSRTSLQLAKKRLAFEEILIFRLSVELSKQNKKQQKSVLIDCSFQEDFQDLLDFELTESQKKVIAECINDILNSPYPMNRLLQGDVGCGKTVVAACLCFCMAKNNIQSAFMVPTEILSFQHFEYLKNLFKSTGINVELLTSSTRPKERKRILLGIQNGLIHILIGTHSLISGDVNFLNLGLVITDEQHRFGVNQRLALSSKGHNPHVLVMSATPIPRTLAMVLYCDLDISVIDQLPAGRKTISTYLINSEKRNRAFLFIEKLINQGRQCFIICPLIQDSDLEANSIQYYHDLLSKSNLAKFPIGIIHGKLSEYEKYNTMQQFIDGEIKILLATTVVEVGIDVKNASVIMIENAERFGLSQLHQLRGRVGRGNFQSFCILVSDSDNQETLKRLNVMCTTHDGFDISNQDLKLRGPGEFFGTKQHGIFNNSILNILEDLTLFEKAYKATQDILLDDPDMTKKDHKKLKALINLKTNFLHTGI